MLNTLSKFNYDAFWWFSEAARPRTLHTHYSLSGCHTGQTTSADFTNLFHANLLIPTSNPSHCAALAFSSGFSLTSLIQMQQANRKRFSSLSDPFVRGLNTPLLNISFHQPTVSCCQNKLLTNFFL